MCLLKGWSFRGAVSAHAVKLTTPRYGFIRGLAACFGDRRDPRFTEFSVEELVGQRIYGLALGYEDVNDHEELRADPLMAVLVGREDPLGRDRRSEADRGKACAGKSTLNRLELSSVTQDKYRKRPNLLTPLFK